MELKEEAKNRFIAYGYMKGMNPLDMLKSKKIYGMNFQRGKKSSKNNHMHLSATKKLLDTYKEDSKQEQWR